MPEINEDVYRWVMTPVGRWQHTRSNASSFWRAECPAGCGYDGQWTFRHRLHGPDGRGHIVVARCPGCGACPVWTVQEYRALVEPQHRARERAWELQAAAARSTTPVSGRRTPIVDGKACHRVSGPEPATTGGMVCRRCGVGVRRSRRTRTGWQHVRPRT